MKQQFENQDAKKLKDKTDSDTAAEKRIDRVAKKAAGKSAKAEQLYDEDHPIFSK